MIHKEILCTLQASENRRQMRIHLTHSTVQAYTACFAKKHDCILLQFHLNLKNKVSLYAGKDWPSLPGHSNICNKAKGWKMTRLSRLTCVSWALQGNWWHCRQGSEYAANANPLNFWCKRRATKIFRDINILTHPYPIELQSWRQIQAFQTLDGEGSV